MGEKVLPFRWYGGKYSHLDFILPQLPSSHHYVEPYGGSAAVLFNRTPSPVETYNDIDGDVVTFFEVLRDQPEVLLRNIALTPFSREELSKSVELMDSNDLDKLERARLFFVRAGQTRTGLAQEATPGRWAICKSSSRRGMSGNVSRYYGRLEHLREVANRLRRVQFENRDAVDVIQQNDGEDVLFYCDPPYPHEVRGDTKTYGYEMTDREHRELAEVLRECDADVAVSGYRCELYEELFEEHGWTRIDDEEKTNHATKGTRKESLWVNYEPPERESTRRQTTLSSFDDFQSGNKSYENVDVDHDTVLTAFKNIDAPFTEVCEIAERIDVPAEVVCRCLDELQHEGVVESKSLSLGGEAWWICDQEK